MALLTEQKMIQIKNGRRKMVELKDKEEEKVIKAYKEQKIGARRLEMIIEIEYCTHIPPITEFTGSFLNITWQKKIRRGKCPGKIYLLEKTFIIDSSH